MDTNVLISGLRSNAGASYAVLKFIREGRIRISLSVPLAIEYESVALRPSLLPALNASEVRTVVDTLCALAHHQKIFFRWRPFLIDPGDGMVLELALAAGTPYIFASNTKHFAGAETLGIRAIKPFEALKFIQS